MYMYEATRTFPGWGEGLINELSASIETLYDLRAQQKLWLDSFP